MNAPDRPTREQRPTARLLDDGHHVEFAHTCNGARVVATLPMPPWQVVGRDPLEVEPSVDCRACGTHGWIGDPRFADEVGPPLADPGGRSE